MEFNYIEEIDRDRGTWKIKAKVTHMWEYKEQGETHTINLILTDGKGTSIMASIGKTAFSTHLNSCELGKCYFFTKFNVIEAVGQYRATKHPCKIIIYRTSIIKQIADLTIEGSIFNFVSFSDILCNKHKDNYLLDVMGEVIQFSNYNETAEKKTLNVDLIDENGDKLGVRLWETYAQQVYEHIKNPMNENMQMILVLRFAKMKSWQGNTYVQNCLGDNSLMYINPEDIFEVSEFKKRMEKKSNDQTEIIEASSSCSVKSTETKFLECQKIKFSDLQNVTEEGEYGTVGTIYAIDISNEWWYRSCSKCCALITTENGLLRCPKCNLNVSAALARYKTHIKVKDSHGDEAILILWDPQAKKEIGASAKELRDKLDKTEFPDALPMELDSLIDREYLFHYKVSNHYNIIKRNKTYTIKNLTNDANIISKFLEKEVFQTINEVDEPKTETFMLESHSIQDETQSETPLKRINDEAESKFAAMSSTKKPKIETL